MLKMLAKNHVVKLLIQKAISFVPGDAGFSINEGLVRLTHGNLANRFEIRQRIDKGLHNCMLIAEKSKFQFEHKTILEVGTGWHGIDLILFWLLGARSIITVDHHLHIQKENIRAVIQTFLNEGFKKKIHALHFVGFREKMHALAAFSTKDFEVVDFFNFLRVRFLKRRSCLITPKDLSGRDIDLFYSESVLQRIPVRDLTCMVKRVSTHFSPNAVSFHRLDQKDINAQDHVDTQLWRLEYLKHEDFVYNIIMCRFNFQNRLRESDFINILRNHSLKTVYLDSHYSQEDIDLLKTKKLASRFLAYEYKDLATFASVVISTFMQDQSHS